MHLSVEGAVGLAEVVDVPLRAVRANQPVQVVDQALAHFLDKVDDFSVIVRRHFKREQRNLAIELLCQPLKLLHLGHLDQRVS